MDWSPASSEGAREMGTPPVPPDTLPRRPDRRIHKAWINAVMHALTPSKARPLPEANSRKVSPVAPAGGKHDRFRRASFWRIAGGPAQGATASGRGQPASGNSAPAPSTCGAGATAYVPTRSTCSPSRTSPAAWISLTCCPRRASGGVPRPGNRHPRRAYRARTRGPVGAMPRAIRSRSGGRTRRER